MEAETFNTQEVFTDFMKCDNDMERFLWIENTLQKNGIEYEFQSFESFSNIICRGTSKVWVSAHFDTIHIENCANDNSASIINLIHLKKIMPEINVVFLDAEEPPMMGLGSTHFSKYLKETIKDFSYVINMELTGYGNCVCLGSRGGKSRDFLDKQFLNKDDFYISEVTTPFSDTDIFLKNGIDSTLLMLLPSKEAKVLTESMYHCHTAKDTFDKMDFSVMDMLVKNLKEILTGEEI